ncbi:MAG: site-2 protease family protein [archaeon]
MDLVWIILILLVTLVLPPFLFRRFFKPQQFAIVSLFKTKKFLPFIDKHSKYKFWDYFADIGFVIGFGLIGFDWLVARKRSLKKRILLNLIIVVVLAVSSWLIVTNLLSVLPSMASFAWLLVVSFTLFGLSGFTIALLLIQAIDILVKLLFTNVQPCPGAAPVIPGVKIPNVPLIPVHVWISFVIILVVHEFSHGFLARKFFIKLKSVGVILFGIFPIGAFVEPDEKQLSKAKPLHQVRVLSAGSTANLFTALFVGIFLLLSTTLIITPFVSPYLQGIESKAFNGVIIQEVVSDINLCGDSFGSPAFGVLKPGMIIKEVNGKPIKTVSDFLNARESNKEFVNLTVDNNGLIESYALQPNSLGRLGIMVESVPVPGFVVPFETRALSFLTALFIEFFVWLILLNFAIASFNFLPLSPFDGGKITNLVLPNYLPKRISLKKRQKMISLFFLILILVLLFINFLPIFL